MKRRSAGMSFEICGDEQEQHRIELEHNLQNTEISFHISTDDEQGRRHMDSSVEYPRHISEPSFAADYHFAHRSRESMGDHIHSPNHAWSYRTEEDEEGINPFGAETMSTAAHHASAVTITAGLGGGRAARAREPSLSGAEYDPDRPLHAMMGVNVNSIVDHNLKPESPIVAELDRLLNSGHAPPRSNSMRSRSVRLMSSLSPSSSTSNSVDHPTPRPKLADHLRHVSFSPSRPRTAQGFNPTSPVARSIHGVTENSGNKSMNISTPHISKRFTTQAAFPAEIRLQPPTPSTTGSKFTRMAKGINKDLEAVQQILSSRHASTSSRPASAPPVERNPFHDEPDVAPRMSASKKRMSRDTTKSRIYLPDVTGLTHAVESPLRFGAKYYPFRTDRPRESEARLVQTLSSLQTQLRNLEEENSISRRRVHELELELEDCKREVMRERTRMIEREEIRKSDASIRLPGSSRLKGKNRAKDISIGFIRPELDDERLRARYKEVVDEKKALEALVTSLRSHLTRLTAELSSHQELLAELKRLRELDSRALQEKSNEIMLLREEVQRLAGEVEVLRGVVEDGLRERRVSKESIQIDREEERVAELEEHEENDPISHSEQLEDDDLGITQDDEDDGEVSEEDTEILDPPGNKTIRTDRATFGESTGSKGMSVQFVDDEDLVKIAAEVEERRSNVSNGSVSSSSSSAILVRGGAETRIHPQPVRVEEEGEEEQLGDTDPETPFPRIRGEHLERLFFSVPEHDAKTCTVCYRKRDRPYSTACMKPGSHKDAVHEDIQETRWGTKRGGKLPERNNRAWERRKGGGGGGDGRLPPQTIVTRVIRELEDDFTHYKSVYVELADQYKVMDAVSDVRRRNTLAKHLREVVDILEQKGDQIASLYGVLDFKDKPISESVLQDDS